MSERLRTVCRLRTRGRGDATNGTCRCCLPGGIGLRRFLQSLSGGDSRSRSCGRRNSNRSIGRSGCNLRVGGRISAWCVSLLEEGFNHLLRATPTSSIFFVRHQLCDLNEGQFDQQAFVPRGAVVQVTVVAQFQGFVEEGGVTLRSLFLIALCHSLAHLEQGQGDSIACHEQISEV